MKTFKDLKSEDFVYVFHIQELRVSKCRVISNNIKIGCKIKFSYNNELIEIITPKQYYSISKGLIRIHSDIDQAKLELVNLAKMYKYSIENARVFITRK
jgi:hypothetical protein